MLIDAALSAVLNVLVLAALPLLGYFAYHKARHKRGAREILIRCGLTVGETRYIGYCAVFALLVVSALVVWPPPLQELLREGSAWRPFAGMGLGRKAVAMSLLYGVVKTGFAEEFLFRGLIAGSLSRRFAMRWANLMQALVFLVPHLLLLFIMPEMWLVLPAVFLGALFVGWARIRSGSILGPWLAHACLNIAMGLSVAIRSATAMP
ncbi:MAG TPA: CPBP family intramembrane glutamic endopeptidase [Vicinamibacteria bacterium]|nr:CPBP family intramembrane glutamic endopeptidase [Vicinamibacteria bacterium]